MAGSTEMLNAIMLQTFQIERQLSSFESKIRVIESALSRLQLRKPMKVIRKPAMGRDYTRKLRLVYHLRDEIEKINASISDESVKLETFPSDRSLEEIHKEALSMSTLVLAKHMDSDYGNISYNDLFFTQPKTHALIVEDLAQRPEIAVFAQTAGYWGVRELIKTDIAYRKRALKRNAKKSKDSSASSEPSPSPSDIESS